MSDRSPLERIAIVLVQPKEPGNVGAAARAMKTMGLKRLVLVRGPDTERAEARRMAHGAHDILRGAHRYDTLEDALAECRLAIATTHRRRRGGAPLLPVEVAAPRLLGATGPVAIVFGREDRGLTTAEAALCGGLCRLPAATRHPSLNLAQAVMIVCWELAQESRRMAAVPAPRAPGRSRVRSATRAERTALLQEWAERLAEGRADPTGDARLLASLQRLLHQDSLDHVQLATLRRLVRTLARRAKSDG